MIKKSCFKVTQISPPDKNDKIIHFAVSQTDIGIFLVLMLVNVVGQILIYGVHQMKYRRLNSFLCQYCEIKLPPHSAKYLQKLRRKIQAINIVEGLIHWILAMCLTYTFVERSWIHVMDHFGVSNGAKWPVIFGVGFSVATLYSSPCHLSTEMLVDTIIGGMSYLGEAWHSEILKRREFIKEKREIPHNCLRFKPSKLFSVEDNLEDLMDLGFTIGKITKSANQVVSPFVMIDMMIFLTSAVSWFYIGSAVFFEGNLNPNKALYAVTSLSFGLSNIARIWKKCNLAQLYLDTRATAVKELQKDVLDNCGELSPRLRWKAEIMQERLARDDAFAPHAFFVLNRATAIPCIASIITYFIIIIQFKLSEQIQPLAYLIKNETDTDITQ